jgi:crossover junction endodeoxyribonuclease RuvC
MRVIGVDPGLAFSGWGIVESRGSKLCCLGYGVIETTQAQAGAGRLHSIYEGLCAVIEKWEPAAAAVETLFFGRNAKSAMQVAEARGVCCAALAAAGLEVADLHPNEIKKGITGVVRVDKRQVQEMVKLVLGLESIPKPDHAADALAAAVCLLNRGF